MDRAPLGVVAQQQPQPRDHAIARPHLTIRLRRSQQAELVAVRQQNLFSAHHALVTLSRRHSPNFPTQSWLCTKCVILSITVCSTASSAGSTSSTGIANTSALSIRFSRHSAARNAFSRSVAMLLLVT